MTGVPARGEVWWCEPAEIGRRPVVILSRDVAIPRLRRALVGPCTTTIRGIPSEVVLEPLTPGLSDPSLGLLGRRLGVLAAGQLPPAPRPQAVDLHLEREAEHDPDHHHDAEHGDALEGGVDDDRPDDVGDDQDLEAEQDAAAQVAAQSVVALP